jgi:ketosteroid isomerase-like protein
MAARKKAAKKVTQKKAPPSRKKTARKPRKTVAKQKSSPTEALARKIVRLANHPEKRDLAALYAEGCVSREPQGPTVSGISALRSKAEAWDALVDSQRWTARNTFVKNNRICIEWQCQLKLRDGRELEFEEVAVHEVKGGKIVAERYYHDPSVFAPPAQTRAAAEPEPRPDDEATRVLPVASPEEAPALAAELAKQLPAPAPEEKVPPGTPPLDPLDL